VDAFAAPKTIKVHYSTSQRQEHNPATVLIPPLLNENAIPLTTRQNIGAGLYRSG
jgi:hypothetical protein